VQKIHKKILMQFGPVSVHRRMTDLSQWRRWGVPSGRVTNTGNR